MAALGWGLSALPGFVALAVAADVSGYTLINADTDLPIMALTPGMALDLATLPPATSISGLILPRPQWAVLDTDGSSTLSSVRAVVVAAGASQLLMFPSPASESLLHYAIASPTTDSAVLELFIMLGQRRPRFPVAAGGVGTVKVASLPSGTYVLRMVGKGSNYTARFVRP